MKKILFILITLLLCNLSFDMIANTSQERIDHEISVNAVIYGDFFISYDDECIFRDEIFSITINETTPGDTYILQKNYKTVATKTATSDKLVFTGAFGVGSFGVRDDKGRVASVSVMIREYWPLNQQFKYVTQSPAGSIDKNGDVILLALETAEEHSTYEMQRLFDRYNAGDYPGWDSSAMYIELARGFPIKSGYLYYVNVYCAPNVGPYSFSNNTGLQDSKGSYHILQDSYGELTNWKAEIQEDDPPYKIRLTHVQPLVTYHLYENNKLVSTVQPKADTTVVFENIDPGLYSIQATYKNATKLDPELLKVRLDEYIQQEPLITVKEKSFLLDKNGGVRSLMCNKDILVDSQSINRAIEKFNQENKFLKMTLMDITDKTCTIQLSWTPNFAQNEIVADSKFIFNGSSHIQFILSGGGEIVAYDVTSGTTPIPYIRLSGSQIGIEYEMIDRGVPSGLKISGTGKSIEFSNISDNGVYTIRGTEPITKTIKDMNGVAIFREHPEDLLTSSTNAISTKTYYDGTHSYADITYYDGFGAPYQTVLNRAAPDGRNLVAPILYDDMYRDNATVLLPFPVDMYTGERVLNAEQEQRRYYSQRTDGVRDNSAYSTNVFDKSGLDRIRYSYRPGDIYRQENKFAEYLYETNDTADKVLDFKYNYEDGSITVAGYAKAGLYTKNTVIDEDGNTSARFADANGNTVLDRRYFSQSYFTDTYYVYDPCFNRLVWVIPPEGSARIISGFVLKWDDDTANQYCYRYLYDGRGNMIERKLPGCEKESFVYDKGDRLVFSRDGNLQARKQWLYHVYDNHGNLLRQNLLDYDISREQLQSRYETLVDNLLPVLGGTTDMDIPYDSDGGATLSRKLAHYVFGNVEYSETATGFVETAWTAPVDMAYRGVGFPGTPLQDPKGLKTYEKLAVLGDDAGEPRYVERTYFYDYKKRLMQVVERNPEGGISRTSYDYDLVGNVVRYKELRQPYAGADEDMVTASYVYDNRRRLIREVRALNYENSVAVDYEYDDLGKLVGKTTRNGGLNTTMAYNLQGWQTDMQVTDSGSPLFDTHLRYYNPQHGQTTPSYAGNISEWTWRQGGESDENTYAFTYDSHSRLTDTDQYINGEFDNQFVEDYMSYDYNGNIKFLKRYEHGILKNYYVYRYNGNQLTALDDLSASSPATSSWITPASSAALGDPDPTPDPAVPVIPRDTIYSGVGYVYDSAGNVLYDSHTGLNLRYNQLNLIEKVMRGDTIVAKYSYLSDGTKLSATDSAGNGLYYSGSLIYTKHGSALTMESCAFTGGRFVATATGVEARYFVTDHLGSVRAVVNDEGEVLERNDYYPFGSRWDDGLLSDNRYRYNGKEAQAFLNNPYLDYGARQYDSDGAVWLGTDQLSELYYHIGSYAYCANNPINAIDADGRLIIFVGGFEPNRSVTSAIIGTMMLSNSLPSQMKAAMMASAAPNRDFSKKDYYDWGSVNELYIDTYNDQNALYTQGRTTLPGSSASKRYNMGLEAGRNLVQQILAGEVELTDDETIKLVGHSQGAAYAAGIAQALIDAGYQDRIGFVDYIAAHQPSGFSHPQGVVGRQFGSTRDILSRRGKKKINNIKDENYHTDGFGSPFGHSITGTELYDFLQKCITAGVPITSN